MSRDEQIKKLKKCLESEILRNKKSFSWVKVLVSCYKHRKYRFLFWWRVASYLYNTGDRYKIKFAKVINNSLMSKYNTEIELKADIDVGLSITHYQGIVISGCAKIGKNFTICQNSVIGIIRDPKTKITIGDNVFVGSNSCIIGDNLIIGDNVEIGAMSFVNKDIPSNCTYYTEKTKNIIMK
ncbi:serine acetyltransferase [Hafnia paralvei]|uniref:serine acetyltransferase n=1 Tax=Hafnia paralvei TaxID=546367 RepID=UPI002032662B|nr:serine acetyltransferase [Hafnia paralvei]